MAEPRSRPLQVAAPCAGGITAHQLAALNRLIAEIAPRNRFYETKLRAAGGLGGFRSLDEFRERMPFTTKQELVSDQAAHPPFGTLLTYAPATYTRFHQTSGTSGRPLVWLDDPTSWQWVIGNWKRVWESAGATAGDAAFFAFSFGPFLGFWAAFDSALQCGVRAIPAGGLGSAERLSFLLAQRPRFLCCTPTYALRLAEVAHRESISLAASGVERILVAGEPGGSIPQVRLAIERAWPGARVIDHHGMTEVGPVSCGDEGPEPRLHPFHESYLCEVVHPGTGDPVPIGQGRGELVLTTLGRAGSPLFRYRTGDLVEPIAPDAGDPAAFLLRGGILGRSDDMVIVRGVNLYPAAVDAAVRTFGGISEYRVEVDRRGTMPQVTMLIDADEHGRDLCAGLARHLHAVFQLRIEVRAALPGSLPAFEMKARRWTFLG